MPRLFVNALNDFVIQGGMVSFTLADVAMRAEGDRMVTAPPEEVARVTMRESDFAALLEHLNARATSFERETGRKLGADTR